ncbi:hypothetical protein SDC9_160835 [bioreactor metagenome]|uniref:Uncharacterized protein n=1 Tax=bioreactor metagenome TaxID=1076179 RepID=A0A645FM73_9ZZZZ
MESQSGLGWHNACTQRQDSLRRLSDIRSTGYDDGVQGHFCKSRRSCTELRHAEDSLDKKTVRGCKDERSYNISPFRTEISHGGRTGGTLNCIPLSGTGRTWFCHGFRDNPSDSYNTFRTNRCKGAASCGTSCCVCRYACCFC